MGLFRKCQTPVLIFQHFRDSLFLLGVKDRILASFPHFAYWKKIHYNHTRKQTQKQAQIVSDVNQYVTDTCSEPRMC